MSQNSTFKSKQVKGLFTKKSKIKIAIEEFIQNEMDYLSQQYDNLNETRVLLVDSLLIRKNKSISSYWFKITDDQIWILISYPVVTKLDNQMLSLLLKFIISTIYKISKNEHVTISEAEKSTFQNYIDDMSKIRSKKGVQLAEKLKQVLFLLVNQYYKSKYPVQDPEKSIPPSDKHLRAKLEASIARIKSKVPHLQFNDNLRTIKFRIIPYLFQDIVIEQAVPLRLKMLHSLLVKNSMNQNSFSIILISTQLLEILDKDIEILDVLLGLEIISIENALKFNRGIMEKEIYSIVSRDTDASETALYKYFSKDVVSKAKEVINKLYDNLIFQDKTSVIKVYE